MLRWRLADRSLEFPPPLAVGIVNVTPDSFYSGARSETPERAVEDGAGLAEQGFDLVDVGAVPVASEPPIGPDEEIARLIPAVKGLAEVAGVPITADTSSTEVAAAALDAGAVAINDISGSRDAAMLDLVSERGCGYVLTHRSAGREATGPPASERDPIARLREWFGAALEEAMRHGVDPERVVLDPGLDLALSVDDDLEVLRRLSELRELGRPLFVALSRKDFLGALLVGSWEERASAEEREWATAAATTLAVQAGADLLRLHDSTALDAMRVAAGVAYG